jgi:hypothetical protein
MMARAHIHAGLPVDVREFMPPAELLGQSDKKRMLLMPRSLKCCAKAKFVNNEINDSQLLRAALAKALGILVERESTFRPFGPSLTLPRPECSGLLL